MPDTPRTEKSLPALAAELWDLVRTYVKQETIGPVRGLGRFVAFGIAGSILLAVGLVLLSIGLLRALQAETGSTFEGNWSWAPYLITFAGCIAVAGLAVLGTRKRGSRS